MAVTVEHIVFDAANAQRLATFWAEILGRDVDPEASEYFATVGRSGSAPLQPVFMFIQVPEERVGKNRLHVDLASEDRRAEVNGQSPPARRTSATSTSTAPSGPPCVIRRATSSTSRRRTLNPADCSAEHPTGSGSHPASGRLDFGNRPTMSA